MEPRNKRLCSNANLVPKNEAYLFYFEEDKTYAIIKQSSRSLPSGVNDLCTGDSTTIRIGGIAYAATLIKAGALKAMEAKQDALEKRIVAGTLNPDQLSFLDRSEHGSQNTGDACAGTLNDSEHADSEVSNRAVLEPMLNRTLSQSAIPVNEEASTPINSTLNSTLSNRDACLIRELRQVLSPLGDYLVQATGTLSGLKREVKRLRNSLTDNRVAGYEQQPIEEQQPVVFGNQNLAVIPAATPQELGTQLARALFTDEELKKGMLGKKRQRQNARASLSPTRSSLAIRAINQRFAAATSRDAARSAFNQIGLDLRTAEKNSSSASKRLRIVELNDSD